MPPTITSGTRADPDRTRSSINDSAAKKAHLVAGDKAKVLVPTTGVIDVTVTGIYHLKTGDRRLRRHPVPAGAGA